MAYCKECGAYIPDGQEECLACGYDPRKKTVKNKGEGGFAYEFDSAKLREELEKQRQRIKEESRKWAEQETARRQAEQNRQEEEQRSRDKQASQEGTAAKKEAAPGELSQSSQNLMSAVAYLGLLFLVPLIFGGDKAYTRFHARQGIRLFLFGIAADVLAALLPIGWILSLARVYFIFKGMSAALNGRMEPLPYIGTIGKK